MQELKNKIEITTCSSIRLDIIQGSWTGNEVNFSENKSTDHESYTIWFYNEISKLPEVSLR